MKCQTKRLADFALGYRRPIEDNSQILLITEYYSIFYVILIAWFGFFALFALFQSIHLKLSRYYHLLLLAFCILRVLTLFWIYQPNLIGSPLSITKTADALVVLAAVPYTMWIPLLSILFISSSYYTLDKKPWYKTFLRLATLASVVGIVLGVISAVICWIPTYGIFMFSNLDIVLVCITTLAAFDILVMISGLSVMARHYHSLFKSTTATIPVVPTNSLSNVITDRWFAANSPWVIYTYFIFLCQSLCLLYMLYSINQFQTDQSTTFFIRTSHLGFYAIEALCMLLIYVAVLHTVRLGRRLKLKMQSHHQQYKLFQSVHSSTSTTTSRLSSPISTISTSVSSPKLFHVQQSYSINSHSRVVTPQNIDLNFSRPTTSDELLRQEYELAAMSIDDED